MSSWNVTSRRPACQHTQLRVVIWCYTIFRKSLAYEWGHTHTITVSHTHTQTEGNINSFLPSVIRSHSLWTLFLQSATAWVRTTCTHTHKNTRTVAWITIIKAWELQKVIFTGAQQKECFHWIIPGWGCRGSVCVCARPRKLECVSVCVCVLVQLCVCGCMCGIKLSREGFIQDFISRE